MLEVLFIYLICILVTIIFGFATIKLIKLDVILDSSFVFLSPVIGLISIITISQILGLILMGKIVTIFTVVLFFGCYIYIAKDIRGYVKLLFKNKFAIAGFFIASIVSLCPMLYLGYATSFNSFNNDVIAYLMYSTSLNEASFLHILKSPINMDFPAYKIPYENFKGFERVGLDYFTINVMNITGMESYKVFGVISCFIYSNIVFVLYYISDYILTMKKMCSYIVIALTCVSPMLIRVIYAQYVPQALGISLLWLSIGILYRIINRKDKKLIVVEAIFISGIISVYNEILVYLLMIMFVVFVVDIYKCKNNYKETIYKYIKLAILSMLINIPAFILMIGKQLWLLGTAKNNKVGGITIFLPIFKYIGHMLGIFPSIFMNMSLKLYIMFAVCIIILFVILSICYLRKLNNEKRYIIFLLSIFIILHIYFRYIISYPYAVYKNFINMEGIFIIAIAVSATDLLEYIKIFSKMYFKKIAYFLCILFIIIQARSIFGIYQEMFNTNTVINKQFSDLSELNNLVPREQYITIKTEPYFETHIASYFLRNHKLSLLSESYFGDYSKSPSKGISNYILEDNKNDIFNNDNLVKKIWQNDRFVLNYITGSFYNVNFGEGFYDIEKTENGKLFRWMNDKAYINIYGNETKKSNISFDILGVVPTSNTDKTVQVYFNNNLIRTEIVKRGESKTVKLTNILIPKSISNVMRIDVLEGANAVPNDNRKLSISISNFKIEN